MKLLLKGIKFITLLFLSFASYANDVKIIPQPVLIEKKPGYFKLPENLILAFPKQAESVGEYLTDQMKQATGHSIRTSGSNYRLAGIELKLSAVFDPVLGKEGYKLIVDKEKITISGNTNAGLFYGAQTLLQLFPVGTEVKKLERRIDLKLPCVAVTDYPKLVWRGLMLDVARHFFSKDDLKKYIDQMARYKYNILHLHLTDDQAWRIEIPGYPKLTESVSDKNYYTTADIKEIVAFARSRFIEILPEVDVPGHSFAIIQAYPEFSCTPEAKNYKSYVGPITAREGNRSRIALVDNTLCPANERVYTFLEDVFTQLIALFPFDYIHVGGDECYKNFWEANGEILNLMKRERMDNLAQVQGYFFKRIERMINDKGRKVIGWDEIAEGELSSSTVVMNWRGIDEAVKAVKSGNQVIMSPQSHAYLDFMQGDESTEANVYATLRLRRAYEFDPFAGHVNPKYVKGGQANLWTEQVYDLRQAEYMTWPRGLAISEALWSEKKSNWTYFINKVETHLKRMDIAAVKYSPAFYDPIVKSVLRDKQLLIGLQTEVDNLDIYYSTDGSYPDHFSLKYKEEIIVPRAAATLRMITYRNGKAIGRPITISTDDLRKRALRDAQ